MTEHNNYLAKLGELVQRGELPAGEIHFVEVRHDRWCALYRGRPCNCDPEVVVPARLN